MQLRADSPRCGDPPSQLRQCWAAISAVLVRQDSVRASLHRITVRLEQSRDGVGVVVREEKHVTGSSTQRLSGVALFHSSITRVLAIGPSPWGVAILFQSEGTSSQALTSTSPRVCSTVRHNGRDAPEFSGAACFHLLPMVTDRKRKVSFVLMVLESSTSGQLLSYLR